MTVEYSLYVTMETEPRDGYDLPVLGLDDGQFYTLHIPPLICIMLSLISVILTFVMSCKRTTENNENNPNTKISFYKWNKGERFVVYLCICDGLFGIFHFIDHSYILATKYNVYPKELCRFYGFMLVEFIGAQIFMVNLIAINAFLLIFFRKNLDFGKYDYKLLVWTFGIPLVAGSVCVGFGALGPNGYFCFFDVLKGEIANVIICSVLLTAVLLFNITLYILTWYRIRREEFNFKNDESNETLKASHKAARSMSLFVAAFIIQYWAMAIYGIWQLREKNVPLYIFQCGTVFTNIGGVLNGIVFILLRRQRQADRARGEKSKATVRTPVYKRKHFSYDMVNKNSPNDR